MATAKHPLGERRALRAILYVVAANAVVASAFGLIGMARGSPHAFDPTTPLAFAVAALVGLACSARD